MKRILKIVLGLVGALVLLVIVAAIGATLFIDPNDYRDTITQAVKEQTGRDLAIEGDIKLSLFPWLGLELGAVQLGNAEGFGDKPMARIEAAEARVKLLPLLKLQTEIDTVVLRGLEANLQRRADGVSNWDDLAGGEAPTAEKPKQPSAETDPEKVKQVLQALAIGGIVIEGANVEWRDDLNKQQFKLNDFNFKSGEIRIGEAIPLELSTKLASSAPKMEGSIDFSGDVTAEPLEQRYRLAGMKLAAKVKGEVVPGGKLDATLKGDAAVDLSAQSLKVSTLSLDAMGLSLSLTVDGQKIIDKPHFSGKLSTSEFVPRQLLSELGITLPEMADPSAMGKAKLTSRFEAGLDKVALSELSLQFDDTTFGGKASVAKFSAPVIRYDLKLDEIDVDRYLPPPTDQTAETAAAETPAATSDTASTELPLELLRSLDIDGNFNIGKVKVMNLHTDTIVTTVKAKGGKFRVHPLSANMYEGKYSGNLGFDLSGKTPLLSMDEKLSGVQAGPLLKDFMGKPYATGKADFAANMTAKGIDPMAVRQSLNGSGNFGFTNGAVKGINIGQQIRNAYALYKQQPKPAEEEKATDFANLSGSFTVTDGVLSTSDLRADSPLLQVLGTGTVNLVREKLDLRLDTTIIHDDKDIAAGGASELKGEKIPVTIKGKFSDPKVGVDIASVLKAKAQAEVDKKKAELQAEVDKKKAEAQAELDRKKKAAEAEAKKKMDAEKKKLEEQAKDKLKNMLKF